MEETAVATEEVMAPVPDKGKKIVDVLLQRKETSTFETWLAKNYPRPKRRSYKNMAFPVTTGDNISSSVCFTPTSR